jgi:hypothetical protein
MKGYKKSSPVCRRGSFASKRNIQLAPIAALDNSRNNRLDLTAFHERLSFRIAMESLEFHKPLQSVIVIY